VPGEHVEFVERALVEEVLEPLTGEHLALLVLAFDRALRTGVNGLLAPVGEVGELLLHGVRHGWQVTGCRSLPEDRPE
jgi:hypothetical protein